MIVRGNILRTFESWDLRQSERQGRKPLSVAGSPAIQPGRDAQGIAKTEPDHFVECTGQLHECPGCGQWFDMRQLGQVMQQPMTLISRSLARSSELDRR